MPSPRMPVGKPAKESCLWRRWWLPLVTALGLAVSLLSLRVGLFNDDILHRLQLEGKIPGYEDVWYRLYDFTPPSIKVADLVELGYLPWFTHEELRLRFLRPLSSALLAFDHLLFGRNTLPAHLHSLAWFAVLCGVTFELYRRWFRPGVAILSALVFALSGAHAMSLAWLAARHTLVAAVFAALALSFWVRYREDRLKLGSYLAPVFIGASLLSSEAGLGALIFLVCYELGSGRPAARSLPAVGAFSAMGLIYLSAYAALGYGAAGSGAYTSPFAAPTAFLLAVVTRVPVLAGELFGAVPSMLAVDRSAEGVLALFGIIVFAAQGFIVYRFRYELGREEQRTLLWLGAAALISTIPTVGAVLGGRLLPLALIGAAPLVGASITLLGLRLRSSERRRRWLLAAPLGLFVGLHFGLSPLLRLAVPWLFADIADKQQKLALQADLGACEHAGFVYVFTGADPALSLYAGTSIALHAPHKAGAERFRILSMSPQDQKLLRVDTNIAELVVLDEPRRSNQFEHLYRPPTAPLQPGYQRKLTELRVHTIETRSGLFTRLRLQMNEPLEARACAVVWRGGKLVTLPWPQPGDSVRIAYEPGPMGL